MAARAKLRATQKKLSTAEERVRLHKQTDEPDYQRWFNITFAERLAEIRELYEKLADLDSIVWRVEQEILATGCSAAEAYASVTKAIELESRQEESSEHEVGDEANDGDGDCSETRDESEEAREKDSGPQSRLGDEEAWRPSVKKAPTDDSIKQVYRQLVRKLHPDLNPDLPERLKERWFEVQQAYDERDLARLEQLLALCEEGSDGGTFIDRIQSLSRLRLLLKSVTKKLKTSQRQLTKLKTAPAWDFHKTKKDPRRLSFLERDVKFELRNTEDMLAGDIRTLEAQIKRWQEPASRKRNRRDWNLSFEY